MADMKNVIEQWINNNEKSICEKCSHRRVCRAIDNQPCFECNQFEQEKVRCKDCKHYVAPQGTYVCDCFEGLNFATDNDFCSYGERREGE